MKRLSIAPYALILLFLAIALLWIAETPAQSNLPHYRLIFSTYIWADYEELPFEIIRPMCWDSHEGWCDEGMEEQGRRIAYVEDLLTGRHGVLMENSAGTWLWWFLPKDGLDPDPHIDEHYWVLYHD